MIDIRLGQGVFYPALRVVDGRLRILRCRGDEDRPEDVQEAIDEERAVDYYLRRKS